MTMSEDSPEVLRRVRDGASLVETVANQLLRTLGPSGHREQLLRSGNAALLELARRFDPALGVPFRLFASPRLQNAMRDAVRQTANEPAPETSRKPKAGSPQRPEDSPEVLALVREGLGLVEPIALRLARSLGPRAELDELVSCGRAAVLSAARGYDPSRGDSFRTHAKHQAERAMIDGFRKMAALPRRVHEKLTVDDGQTSGKATAEERVRRREKHVAGVAAAQASGLLAQLGLDTHLDFIAVSPKTMPDLASQRNQERALLERCVAALPADEGALIRLHYLDELPIERVAKELGLPRSTARDLHTRALAHLKALAPQLAR